MGAGFSAKEVGRPRGSGHAMTGFYVKSPKGVKLRDRSVQRIVAKVRELCPWLESQDLPLVRRWAELEYHASRLHAYLRVLGEVNGQAEPRRLLDELRKLGLAQAALSDRLGLNPAARMTIKAHGAHAALDLAAAFANAETIEAKPAPEPRNPAQGQPAASEVAG